jgi:hypothetical protein
LAGDYRKQRDGRFAVILAVLIYDGKIIVYDGTGLLRYCALLHFANRLKGGNHEYQSAWILWRYGGGRRFVAVR